MSRTSLPLSNQSPQRRSAVVLASVLGHGLVLGAFLGWSHPGLPVDAPASQMVELAFEASAQQPQPSVAAPPPMPETVPDMTPDPMPAQAAQQPEEPKPMLTDAPPQVTAPSPKPAPVHPLPVVQPRPAAPRPMAAPVTAPAAVASTAESVPPAQQPATPAAAPRISGEWRSSLGAWIGANQVYPEDARRSGAQGNVAVRLTVDHLGHVLTVELVHSAGSALLDETSLAMLKGATLPPFPAEMTQDRLTITVQVHYSLAN